MKSTLKFALVILCIMIINACQKDEVVEPIPDFMVSAEKTDV